MAKTDDKTTERKSEPRLVPGAAGLSVERLMKRYKRRPD